MRRTVLALALLLASSSSAQELRPERLYVGSGIVIGSNRMIALGGAYAGIAEGLEGFSANFAALAHRSPRREDQWDWDAAFSYLISASTAFRDLDNDGAIDDAERSDELLAGLLLQFGRAGIGLYGRSSDVFYRVGGPSDPDASDVLAIKRQLGGLGLAVALLQDQVIAGGGFVLTYAALSHGAERRTYLGAGLEGGVLYRPHRQPFRFGATFRQRTPGEPSDPAQPPTLLGRPLFSGTVSPAVLSVGGSFRLGPGSERYNRLSKSALFEIPHHPGQPAPVADEDHGTPPGRWLVTLQADLILPVKGATSLRAFTHEDAQPVGDDVYLAPRAGVEHETLVKRLRLRAGTYLEPSPFVGRSPRPHLTAGFELFVLSFLDDWSLTGAVDLAPRYYNFSVGVGFWR